MVCLFLDRSLTRRISPSNKVLENTQNKSDRHSFLESVVIAKSRLQTKIKLSYFFSKQFESQS